MNFVHSLQHLALVKVAVEIYTSPEVREYERQLGTPFYSTSNTRWQPFVREKISSLVPFEVIQDIIIGAIKPLSNELRMWIVDHCMILGPNADKKISLCWKPGGTVDRLETAKSVIPCTDFSLAQRFILAIYYWLKDEAIQLWQKISPPYFKRMWTIVQTGSHTDGLPKIFEQWVEWLQNGADCEEYYTYIGSLTNSHFKVPPPDDLWPQVTYEFYINGGIHILEEHSHSSYGRNYLSKTHNALQMILFRKSCSKAASLFLNWPLQCQFLKVTKRLRKVCCGEKGLAPFGEVRHHHPQRVISVLLYPEHEPDVTRVLGVQMRLNRDVDPGLLRNGGPLTSKPQRWTLDFYAVVDPGLLQWWIPDFPQWWAPGLLPGWTLDFAGGGPRTSMQWGGPGFCNGGPPNFYATVDPGLLRILGGPGLLRNGGSWTSPRGWTLDFMQWGDPRTSLEWLTLDFRNGGSWTSKAMVDPGLLQWWTPGFLRNGGPRTSTQWWTLDFYRVVDLDFAMVDPGLLAVVDPGLLRNGGPWTFYAIVDPCFTNGETWTSTQWWTLTSRNGEPWTSTHVAPDFYAGDPDFYAMVAPCFYARWTLDFYAVVDPGLLRNGDPGLLRSGGPWTSTQWWTLDFYAMVAPGLLCNGPLWTSTQWWTLDFYERWTRDFPTQWWALDFYAMVDPGLLRSGGPWTSTQWWTLDFYAVVDPGLLCNGGPWTSTQWWTLTSTQWWTLDFTQGFDPGLLRNGGSGTSTRWPPGLYAWWTLDFYAMVDPGLLRSGGPWTSTQW
ncbi:uncharacterized protein TNIN_15231 [Trichonephila inaurata madagascariensis]|uniref:Uncharacterized protein n=1 Tax=Trichonephila inaurata madagascariensis TaxID=2747483 RepID=A0A8X6YSI1_9ARAC|nr:uncharacterized protein TNIN_15231 [Trichonephila inaurata madagascariensis]